MLLAIYFLVMLGFNFFYVAFPVFAAVNLEWTLAQTGAFFSVLSVMMVLVQGPVLGRASKHLSDGTLVIAGGVLLTASFPLFGAHASWIIYSGAALMALGNGLMWPSLVAVLSKAAGDVHQGAVQGIAGSCGAAASIIGLLSGGVLFNVIGPAIFVVSAATILVSFVLSIPARAPSA